MPPTSSTELIRNRTIDMAERIYQKTIGSDVTKSERGIYTKSSQAGATVYGRRKNPETFARSAWRCFRAAMNRRTLSPLASRDQCKSSMGQMEVPPTAVLAIPQVILEDHL